MQKTLSILLLGLTATTAAHAGNVDNNGADESQAYLQRLDSNGDDRIDLQEFTAPAREQFDAIDLDGDGYLTPEETRGHRAEAPQHSQPLQQAEEPPVEDADQTKKPSRGYKRQGSYGQFPNR